MSLLAILNSIQTNLFRFGGPFLIINATISCLLNLFVFTTNTLRKNPCAICFIAVSIANVLFVYFSFIPLVMQVGYDIDPSSTNIVYCRFRFYTSYVFGCLGPFYMILASIDRSIVTSRDAGIRKRSTSCLAITCIIVLALFWMIFHIHAFIFTEIIQFGPNMFLCYFQPGNYTVFMTYYSLLFNAIIPPLLMIMFGLWTIKNVSTVHNNVHPTGLLMNASTNMGRRHIIHSKDHQLMKMLLVDIVVYIIFRIPFTIYLIYQQITQYQLKSSDQIAIDYFILNVTYFLFIIVPAINCYTNLLISKTFRAELKQTFLHCQIFRLVRPS
ncbi:hypothetical protein I4U23_022696 [Adineta vaga]|nr:hypothetical protein I4U23_022696 [Adineta vaga]